MIPKIVHYCWFGRGKKNPDMLSFLESWRNCLPDYQIIEWNEDNFPFQDWTFCKEAYAIGKWAFVADVCRLWALDKFGGIYLDTDVEVIKSFDPFLKNKSFLGLEAENKVGTGCIGAEKGTLWVHDFLLYYKDRHFINLKGRPMDFANTDLLTAFLVDYIEKPQIYPLDFFCAKLYNTHEVVITDNTVCIHHYKASWFKPLTISYRLRNLWVRLTH